MNKPVSLIGQLSNESVVATCIPLLFDRKGAPRPTFQVVRERAKRLRPVADPGWFFRRIRDAERSVVPDPSGFAFLAEDGEPQAIDSTDEEEAALLSGVNVPRAPVLTFEIALAPNQEMRKAAVKAYRLCLLVVRGPMPGLEQNDDGVTFALWHSAFVRGRWHGTFSGDFGHIRFNKPPGTEGAYIYGSVFDSMSDQEQAQVDAARCLTERLLATASRVRPPQEI